MDIDYLQTIYQPAYVEAYLEHRQGGQDISEWTLLEGHTLFASSDIYCPVEVAVAIRRQAHNEFALDLNKSDWHEQFTSAVRSTLEENGLATPNDKVELVDVRGNPVKGATAHKLRTVHTIYPLVNGTRSCEIVNSTEGIGLSVRTPPTHSVNKEQLLSIWGNDVCEDAADIVIDALSGSKDFSDVNNILGSTHEQNVKPQLVSLIMQNGGHLDNLGHIIEIHGEPSVLRAIEQGDIDAKSIASDIADMILDGVAESMQASSADVDSFFKVRQARAIVKRSGSSGNTRMVIASSGAGSANPDIIDSRYPTDKKLYREIVSHALINNSELVGKVVLIVKRGPTYISLGGKRRHRKKKSAHAHHSHHTSKGGNQTHVHHRRRKKNSVHSHSAGASHYKGAFHDRDGKRYLEALRRRDQLAGRPSRPGLLLLTPGSTQAYKGKRVPGSWKGAVKSDSSAGYKGQFTNSEMHQSLGEPPSVEPIISASARVEPSRVNASVNSNDGPPSLMNLNVLESMGRVKKNAAYVATKTVVDAGPPSLLDVSDHKKTTNGFLPLRSNSSSSSSMSREMPRIPGVICVDDVIERTSSTSTGLPSLSGFKM